MRFNKSFWEGASSGAQTVFGLLLISLPVISIILFGFFGVTLWVSTGGNMDRGFVIFVTHIFSIAAGVALTCRVRR